MHHFTIETLSPEVMPGIPFSLAAPDTPTVLSLCLFWSTNRCRFQRCPQIHGVPTHIVNSRYIRPTCLKDETSSWDLVQQQLGTWKWCTKSRVFSLVSWFEITLLVRVYWISKPEGRCNFEMKGSRSAMCQPFMHGGSLMLFSIFEKNCQFIHPQLLSPPLSLQLFFHIGGNANGREIESRHIGISLHSCSLSPKTLCQNDKSATNKEVYHLDWWLMTQKPTTKKNNTSFS